VKLRTIGRDWQRALFIPLTILAWLAVIVVIGWLLSHVVKTILTLVFSGVVAFALTPLVGQLQRWMPRTFAIFIAYVLGFGVILGMITLVVTTAAGQITTFVGELPYYESKLHALEPHLVQILGPFGVTKAKINVAEHQVTDYLSTVGTSMAKSSVGIITSVLGTIVDIVLVLILSVYLTANGPKISAQLRRQTPGDQRRYTTLFIAIVNRVVGGYIRGTLTLATLVGTLVGAGMFVLHVPYAILLGILAFFMEFIPIVGVLVSGAVCVVIALFQGWITAALVLAYFVVVHVIEGDVVGPRIMGRAVGIHPATALVALVAGTELFGVWGALFGAPLAGLIQAIVTAAVEEIRGGDATAVLDAVENAAKAETKPATPPAGPPSDEPATPEKTGTART
jgi:predicted PurR-regulated permease PerM